MKKLFVAVVAVMMTAGFAANAQDNAKKCGKADCDKEQCSADKCKRACPFEDLNLTDAQKAQIKELNARKCQDKANKKAEQKADKKADKQARMEARKQARMDYLAKLKTILTPEQYEKYLENDFARGGNHAKGMQQARGGKDKKAHRGDAGKKCNGAGCDSNK